MRWSRALVAAIFVLAVAACSTPGSSSGDGSGNGNGNGDGNGGSSQAQTSQAQTSQAPASQGDGNGGNGGNGGSTEDVFNALIPPNSTEVSKTAAGGGFFASYLSTDSVDSLTNYYESAIPGAGMQIFSTTSSQGGNVWIFAQNEESNFGGSVSVFPNPDGGGTQVTVTVASG